MQCGAVQEMMMVTQYFDMLKDIGVSSRYTCYIVTLLVMFLLLQLLLASSAHHQHAQPCIL